MKNKSPFPDLYPNIEDWPIYKLHAKRDQFIDEIVSFCMDRFRSTRSSEQLADIIARTIYTERIRMNEEPWKVDPPNERQFWKKIRKELIKKGLDSDEEQMTRTNEALMERIIRRYAEEIVGTFKISTFRFARKFLTAFFKRLLNTTASGPLGTFWGSKRELYEKLRVFGPLDDIRALARKGTLVILPTHSSNLDSILVGYAMDAVLGLPSFSYGAGLNLYNSGMVAYYMNRLGAYRVDRRKKNPIYLETLKGMSNLSLQKGTNSLFFPGGTRSRSGMLEDKLKLGLLNTTVEAQRAMFEKGEDKKVIIVPLIISYNFVLEAKFLIHNYLKRTGKERYLKTRDQSFSIRKITKFIWQFFAAESDIILSLGPPMDVLGNRLDANGVSYDQFGKAVNLREFFELNGRLNTDLQRESEYTRDLAAAVVRSYFADNRVLPSHVVAFVAFRILCQQNPDLDLYGILRLPLEDFEIPLPVFIEMVGKFQEHLIRLEKEGKLKLIQEVKQSAEDLCRDGISKLGTYHPQKPLKINKKDQVVSEEFNLLFFYHNRLENYELQPLMKKILGGFSLQQV
jgi:glycerol-3-phosphate O-acyltransferase